MADNNTNNKEHNIGTTGIGNSDTNVGDIALSTLNNTNEYPNIKLPDGKDIGIMDILWLGTTGGTKEESSEYSSIFTAFSQGNGPAAEMYRCAMSIMTMNPTLGIIAGIAQMSFQSGKVGKVFGGGSTYDRIVENIDTLNNVVDRNIKDRKAEQEEYFNRLSAENIKTRLAKLSDKKKGIGRLKSIKDKVDIIPILFGGGNTYTRGRVDLDPSAMDAFVIDNIWIKNVFIMPVRDIYKNSKMRTNNRDISPNIYYTKSSDKFYNTSIGKHMVINPKYQFTEYADIRHSFGSVFNYNEVDINPAADIKNHQYPLGRYYSEAIDDNINILHLSFGIAKYNNLFTYLSNTVSPADIYIMKTGNIPTSWFKSFIMAARGYGEWKFIRHILVRHPFKWFTLLMLGHGLGVSKFARTERTYYYLDKRMNHYLSMVRFIITEFMLHLGILADDQVSLLSKQSSSLKLNKPFTLNERTIEMINSVIPNFIDITTGNVNVYNYVGNFYRNKYNLHRRYVKLEERVNEELYKALIENMTPIKYGTGTTSAQKQTADNTRWVYDNPFGWVNELFLSMFEYSGSVIYNSIKTWLGSDLSMKSIYGERQLYLHQDTINLIINTIIMYYKTQIMKLIITGEIYDFGIYKKMTRFYRDESNKDIINSRRNLINLLKESINIIVVSDVGDYSQARTILNPDGKKEEKEETIDPSQFKKIIGGTTEKNLVKNVVDKIFPPTETIVDKIINPAKALLDPTANNNTKADTKVDPEPQIQAAVTSIHKSNNATNDKAPNSDELTKSLIKNVTISDEKINTIFSLIDDLLFNFLKEAITVRTLGGADDSNYLDSLRHGVESDKKISGTLANTNITNVGGLAKNYEAQVNITENTSPDSVRMAAYEASAKLNILDDKSKEQYDKLLADKENVDINKKLEALGGELFYNHDLEKLNSFILGNSQYLGVENELKAYNEGKLTLEKASKHTQDIVKNNKTDEALSQIDLMKKAGIYDNLCKIYNKTVNGGSSYDTAKNDTGDANPYANELAALTIAYKEKKEYVYRGQKQIMTYTMYLKAKEEIMNRIIKTNIEAEREVDDTTLAGIGGFDVVSFQTDYVGVQSASISNGLTEHEVESIINSAASSAVKITRNGVAAIAATLGVTELINKVITTMGEFASAATLGLSNVALGMLYGGKLRMPKTWSDSSSSFGDQHQFRISLRSPYGDPISQLVNIYIPLSFILAGSMPVAIGSTAYGSPLLCSAFQKGICDIELGMIVDVQIERNVGNMGMNDERRPLGVDVILTVADLDSHGAVATNIQAMYNLPATQILNRDFSNRLSRFMMAITGTEFGETRDMLTLEKKSLKFAKFTNRGFLNMGAIDRGGTGIKNNFDRALGQDMRNFGIGRFNGNYIQGMLGNPTIY